MRKKVSQDKMVYAINYINADTALLDCVVSDYLYCKLFF
mgnify:CR=1 FL=1